MNRSKHASPLRLVGFTSALETSGMFNCSTDSIISKISSSTTRSNFNNALKRNLPPRNIQFERSSSRQRQHSRLDIPQIRASPAPSFSIQSMIIQDALEGSIIKDKPPPPRKRILGGVSPVKTISLQRKLESLSHIYDPSREPKPLFIRKTPQQRRTSSRPQTRQHQRRFSAVNPTVSFEHRPVIYQTHNTSNLNFDVNSPKRPKSRDIIIHPGRASKSIISSEAQKSVKAASIDDVTTTITRATQDISPISRTRQQPEVKKVVPRIVISHIDRPEGLVLKLPERRNDQQQDEDENASVSVQTPSESEDTSLQQDSSVSRDNLSKGSSDFNLLKVKEASASDKLSAMLDQEIQNYNDYSQISRLHSSINKSIKEKAKFKPRWNKRQTRQKFSGQSNSSLQTIIRTKPTSLKLQFYNQPIRRTFTRLSSKAKDSHEAWLDRDTIVQLYEKKERSWKLDMIFDFHNVEENCTLELYKIFKNKGYIKPKSKQIIPKQIKYERLYVIPNEYQQQIKNLLRQYKQNVYDIQQFEEGGEKVNAPLREVSHSTEYLTASNQDSDMILRSTTEQPGVLEQVKETLSIQRNLAANRRSSEDLRKQVHKINARVIWLPKIMVLDPFLNGMTKRTPKQAFIRMKQKSQYQFIDAYLRLPKYIEQKVRAAIRHKSLKNYLESSVLKNGKDETGVLTSQLQGPITQVIPQCIEKLSMDNISYLYYKERDFHNFL